MAREGQLLDLLLPLDGGGSLHTQLERAIRDAIRAGTLVPGTALPSTRALARELGVSRGVVFEAYGQLAAEGYLVAKQGAATRVAGREGRFPAAAAKARPSAVLRPYAHDLRPGRPDLASFPRQAWLASWRRALATVPDAELGYPDPRGTPVLRDALTAFLGRSRAVLADPQRIVVTGGVTQGLALTVRALLAQGHTRLAVEDPGFFLHRWTVERAGMALVGVPVDEEGIDVDALAASGARAVLVTPSHQLPMGVVLSPERRAALLAWADDVDGIVVEDDYDGEYRFDRDPVGALQGVAPERVVYAGSVTKTLANGLRLGWLVLPEALARPVAFERIAADGGGAVIEQLALADLIERGQLDRHLRRTRRLYRARRDTIAGALAEHVPDAVVAGAPAGLHLLARLPHDVDEGRLPDELEARGVAVELLALSRVSRDDLPPGVLLGYAHLPEPALVRGVVALGEAARAATP